MSHHGSGQGPWVMADLENGLWGSNISKSKELPTVGAAFVTAMIKGDSGNHWAVKGGDANQATLTTLYDGVRLFVCYVVCNVIAHVVLLPCILYVHTVVLRNILDCTCARAHTSTRSLLCARFPED